MTAARGRGDRSRPGRRGPKFDEFVALGRAAALAAGEVSREEVAAEFGVSLPTVSRWARAWRDDVGQAVEQAAWRRDPDVEAMVTGPMTVDAFVAFRAHFFRTDMGERFETPEAQRRWVGALIAAVEGGQRRLILTAPRQGKTALLCHFVLWLVVRNGNVRVLWIGESQEAAESSTRAVLEELELNEGLRAEILGPGQRWKPARVREWSPTSLTVSTRTVTGMKAATITALGKGGRLQGRDADVIVVDDIQDYEASRSPVTRERDAEWASLSLGSRKEAGQAVITMGSRSNALDLWGRFAANPAWQALVDPVHDPLCALPFHELASVEEHAGDECPVCDRHQDCMLVPSLRSMRWLAEQRAEMADERRFLLAYMQEAVDTGPSLVSIEELIACRSESRRAGEVKHGEVLFGGLDPAANGRQAAAVWAVDPAGRWSLVDTDVASPGGRSEFRRVARAWADRYGLSRWAVESNNAFQWLVDDALVDELMRAGVWLQQTPTTAQSKWSPADGVQVFLDAFRQGRVRTPWGDDRGREITSVLEKEIVSFDRQTAATRLRVSTVT